MAEALSPQRMFPFKRSLTVDPYILPINSATTPVGVAIDRAALMAAGSASFKFINPCPFWVWIRGWSNNPDGSNPGAPTIIGKGHYMPPGAVDLNTSQMPDWIAAMPQAEPGVPLPSDLATAGYRIIMIYGAGL